jgi:peptide deformylase
MSRQIKSQAMAILKVARMGHPVLRKKARSLDRREIKTALIQQLIDDMIATMIEYHGAGLAAPQVHIDVRLFVAVRGTDDEDATNPVVLINPEIAAVGGETIEDWEGCLSIPGVRGRVPRAQEVTVRALNRQGERVEFTARDFAARVIQHEHDHLDGVLFIDRMQSLDSLSFLPEPRATAPAF